MAESKNIMPLKTKDDEMVNKGTAFTEFTFVCPSYFPSRSQFPKRSETSLRWKVNVVDHYNHYQNRNTQDDQQIQACVCQWVFGSALVCISLIAEPEFNAVVVLAEFSRMVFILTSNRFISIPSPERKKPYVNKLRGKRYLILNYYRRGLSFIFSAFNRKNHDVLNI
jgi:hypothetical protein